MRNCQLCLWDTESGPRPSPHLGVSPCHAEIPIVLYRDQLRNSRGSLCKLFA